MTSLLYEIAISAQRRQALLIKLAAYSQDDPSEFSDAFLKWWGTQVLSFDDAVRHCKMFYDVTYKWPWERARMNRMNESYDIRRQRWNDWRNLSPPSEPDFAAMDLSLYELCTLLKDDEGFISMPSYYVLEELVEEYGSDNIVKVIQDIGKKLDGREL